MKSATRFIVIEQRRITIFWALLLAVIFLGTCSSRAFSLLGPFEPWMEETNGLRQPGDIGGPVDINEAYRWNVPKVTYGFDQSFVDYFGTNGEAAVKSAIQILNNLPPSSEINLNNYPYYTTQSFDARALNLLDLKSFALSLLLEQIGLTQPTRYIFVIKQWNPVLATGYEDNWPDWIFPDYVLERNFDPLTFAISQWVNNVIFTATTWTYGDQHYIFPEPLDNAALSYTAVADLPSYQSGGVGSFAPDQYYTGLTYDDVGGLRYLFSTNNIKYETLLSDIHRVNPGTLVNGAFRPGINKISFIAQPVNYKTRKFIPISYRYTDTYITNGILMHQQLSRVVLQPDILFCAGDTGDNIGTPYFARTGTTNWLNESAQNGNPAEVGPGIIQPRIQIVFNKLGLQYGSFEDEQSAFDEGAYYWGSFDNTTNAPVTYPIPQTGTNQMTMRLWLWLPSLKFYTNFDWKSVTPTGSQFAFQTSTNLANWTTIFTVTNNSSVVTYFNGSPSSASRFYRLVPQYQPF